MPLLVQKFGGTSVADSNKILAAARRAIQAHHRGEQVLVVVSARGHTTDELIALAREITDRPPAREMDMLLSTGEQVSVALMAMAIESLGVPAISFTGAQIGLVTDSFHTKARIRNISTERMAQALAEGKIVIVAGFQGVDENYNITTLGRGGSDTTAVALAAVLGADACEIYTDVDGVYTTDPRVVPEAGKIDRISYDEMLELASLGAGVMHSRSIEFAKKYGVPIHVRSSFSDAPGTWIVGERDAHRLGVAVTGAALAKDEARITILGVPDRPGVVHLLFQTIARANIVVDMIVYSCRWLGWLCWLWWLCFYPRPLWLPRKKRAASVCMILAISLEARPRAGAIKATQATQATDLMEGKGPATFGRPGSVVGPQPQRPLGHCSLAPRHHLPATTYPPPTDLSISGSFAC